MSSPECARVLVAQLAAQGVREVVLCPGSRSAPLALALAASDAAGALRLHVRVDERSAGFLALGLAKATGTPAAVVTTSGTAAGNLLPAVMEAAHAGIGLIAITADRPAALVGFGANQTTEQVGLFGGFLRYAARVTSAASAPVWAAQTARAVLAAASGPVHLNVEFDTPLVDDVDEVDADATPPVAAVTDARSSVRGALPLPAGPRTVILAGDATPEAGRAAVQLARSARLPLIAEPSSNARLDPALRCGRLVLATSLADEVERVIVVGHPTLSRPVMRLLARPQVEVIAVSDRDAWPDPGHRVSLITSSITLDAAPQSWSARWAEADAVAAARLDAVIAANGLSGWSLAQAVWDAAADQPLLLGASQLIRDADLTRVTDRPPLVYANRGLAGIDGTVSTAVGLALALDRPTTLLCGDLTFLHDSNGLALGVDEPRPTLRIVVGDDAGGAIFATLEYGASRFDDVFERVFATDPRVDVAGLAASYGVRVTTAATQADLVAALRRPCEGIEVVVVPLARTGRRALTAQITG